MTVGKILLDYVFPISVVATVPAASTAFLKQVCVVAKPKSGQEGNVGNVYECSTMTQVAARTDNANAQQLFNAGMSKVFVLLADEVDIAAYLEDQVGEFWTILISDDFSDADITATAASGTVTISSYANLVDAGNDEITVAGVTFVAQTGAATLGTATFRAATSNDATAASLAAQINAHATTSALVEATALAAVVTITAKATGIAGNEIALAYSDEGTATVGASVSGATLTGGDGIDVGVFDGVVGFSTPDADFAATFAATENRCAFYEGDGGNGAKSMFYAFGKLLSNTADWSNQQYISMPYNDGVDLLGDANSLFDDRVSFVINDTEFGNRLAFFVAGGKAIAAPYIGKNLRIDLQSRALSWIAANQPDYTLVEATLLETELQDEVIQKQYIDRKLISAGTIEISLVQSNFVANADINIAEPKALWKSVGQMLSTL